MTDPIQLLIDAGAIPAEPFDEHSRYRDAGIGLFQPAPGEPLIAYVRRRFIAQRRDIPIVGEVTIQAGDRPDLLAARVLGEPLRYWQVADANAVSDAAELTDTPGARVRVPRPA